MAKQMNYADLATRIYPDGQGGFDFVVMNAEPKISDPDAANAFDRAERTGRWFDFSKVNAGQPYGVDGYVVGRKVPSGTTIDQLMTAVINEIQSQAGIS